MNVEAIDRTIRAIEAVPDDLFSMREFMNECGSPSCIAGYALHAHGEEIDGVPDVAGRAGELLGLSERQQRLLFEPNIACAWFDAEEGHSDWISRPHALACLRNLRETGRVSWYRTRPWEDS